MLNRFRLPFLFIAAASLITGLWSGLQRLGWDLNLPQAGMHHGAIMVGGFIGTLISLEKIIPLKRKVLFLIPFLSGISLLFFFANLPLVSWFCLLAASISLSLIFCYYLLREKGIIYLLMLGGGISWLTGNVILINEKLYPLAFPWWLAFALFVITAERLELMKFLPVSIRPKTALVVLLMLYVLGILLSFHGTGSFISGAALVGIAIWLMRYDLIGISIKKSGLTKFVAVALLCGYVSVLLTGIFVVSLDNQPMAYDAVVHVFFLGFVLSMVFAHGPIILPGVLGVSVKPYHRVLYLWLALLHSSWLIRVTADLYLNFEVRRYSGWITAIAIIGYFATMATLTTTSVRRHAKVL